MFFYRIISIFILFIITSLLFFVPVSANQNACKGVSQKCNKDALYDKIIDKTIYSCYDCKQSLCSDGGAGKLSGTNTTSVCTEKLTTTIDRAGQGKSRKEYIDVKITADDCIFYGGTVKKDKLCASQQMCIIKNSQGCINRVKNNI